MLPIAWMSFIFYLSSTPGLPDFQAADFPVKKGAHFMVYAILYFLLFRAFHAQLAKNPVSTRAYLYPAVVAVMFAISDEIHQGFVPLREARLRDVIIDSAGIFCMYVVIKRNLSFFSRFLRKPSRVLVPRLPTSIYLALG